MSYFPRTYGYDERTFLSLWLAWLFGAGLLIARVWSVRIILLGGSENGQRPVWLYRAPTQEKDRSEVSNRLAGVTPA